jgi:hypothetical protein
MPGTIRRYQEDKLGTWLERDDAREMPSEFQALAASASGNQLMKPSKLPRADGMVR